MISTDANGSGPTDSEVGLPGAHSDSLQPNRSSPPESADRGLIQERAKDQQQAEQHPSTPSPSAKPPATRSQSPTPAQRPASASPSLTPERLSTLASGLWQWMSRPRARLALIGLGLLLTGGLLMTNSVWTLPLVAVGALMVVTAWIGHRLDGRFALEWGESGTQLAFRAKVKTAQPARQAPPRSSSTATAPLRSRELEPNAAEIIDGEAHTIEIDVAELKALIAAAETASGESAPTTESPQAAPNLRVADGRARQS